MGFEWARLQPHRFPCLVSAALQAAKKTKVWITMEERPFSAA
jgi:hypothetical protein